MPYCTLQTRKRPYRTEENIPELPLMKKILMVCMGNICRSPMAQVVTLHLARQMDPVQMLQVDSAGTHTGRFSEPPDARAKKILTQCGYALGKTRSRQVADQDFERYDLILGMDQANMRDLRRLCPPEHAHKLRLFLEFARGLDIVEVPDPYYGAAEGFERVLNLCETGARGLIAHLQGMPG